MKKLNDRARERLDERLAFAKPVVRLQVPPKGWIRAIRNALGMSGPQLGRRMGGVTAQTVDALEKSEVNGTIQLQTLRKVANAFDAKLVYAIVPNTSLAEMVEQRARQIALRALSRVSHTMRLEDQETSERDLAARIEDYVRNELNDRDLWNNP